MLYRMWLRPRQAKAEALFQPSQTILHKSQRGALSIGSDVILKTPRVPNDDFTININLTRASIIRSSYLTALILFRNGRFSISAMAGIPPTPSANPPTSRAQWRFHPLTTPTEWIEDYRPGKYHPVHIGDTFNNSRYCAIRKLGYGSFSTVWLARDTQLERYVALKILVANPDASKHELDIYKALSQSTPVQHEGRSHLMSMIDFFEHKGPNGVHRCLVLDVMGPSTAGALEDLPSSVVTASDGRRKYPVWMAKSILCQTLLGIDFLHENGIVHGDLQQGNILFPVKDLGSISEDELSQNNEISEPVQRIDGNTDLWAPGYLALNRPLTDYLDISPEFSVKISDLGGAFFMSDPPDRLVTPVGLRSPELVFENKISKDQDIWSFGCMIFELLTSRQLFLVGTMASDEEIDDDHFLQFYDILGPLPSRILSQYPRARVYCNGQGEKVKHYIGDLPEGFDPNEIQPMPSLEQFFDQERPAELSVEEAGVIKGLLRQILDYDPCKRPSASELLRHPWFSNMGNVN